MKAIYQHCVRRQWQTIPGHPYHAKAVDVEINLSVDDEPKRRVKVRIVGSLGELKTLMGDAVELIMETVDRYMQGFFVQALQLDTQTLRLEAT